MSEVPSNTKIFVGGLSFETTDDKLRKYFEKWGEVIDAIVMTDNVSKRSRGFGFITYTDSFSVDHVLMEKEHIVDGRRVEAKRAVPRSDLSANAASFPLSYGDNHSKMRQSIDPVRGDSPKTSSDSGENSFHDINMHSSSKIFVGGLHYETRDHIFRSYFEQFGSVLAAEVMFNRETRKSRGFGFVVFESVDSANAVLQHPHHSIDGKLVEVKKAVPRVVPNNNTNYLSQSGLSYRHCTTPIPGFSDSFPILEEKFRSLENQQLREQHIENMKRYAAVAAAAAADSYAAAVGINKTNFSGGVPRASTSSPSSMLQPITPFSQHSASLPPLTYLNNFADSTGSLSPTTTDPCSLPMFESWDSFKPLSLDDKQEKSFSELWELNTSDTEKERQNPIPSPITCTSLLPSDLECLPMTGSPTYEEVERAIADLSLCSTKLDTSPKPLEHGLNSSRTPWFSDIVGSSVSKSTGHLYKKNVDVYDAFEVSEPSRGRNFFVHSNSLRFEDDTKPKNRLKFCESFF